MSIARCKWGFGWELARLNCGMRSAFSRCWTSRSQPWSRHSSPASNSRKVATPSGRPRATRTGLQPLRVGKERTPVIKKNAGGSLVDLGDGVLCVELHSKMNIIGADTMQIAGGPHRGHREFLGDGHQHRRCALLQAPTRCSCSSRRRRQLGRDRSMVRTFQKSTMSLRYASVPSSSLRTGMALGGGCEIVLHADRVQAAAETYMGLVEAGVGPISPPVAEPRRWCRAGRTAARAKADLQPFVQAAFETMALWQVDERSARPTTRLPASLPTACVDESRAVGVRCEGRRTRACSRRLSGAQTGTGARRWRKPEAALAGVHLAWRLAAPRITMQSLAAHSPTSSRAAHCHMRRW